MQPFHLVPLVDVDDNFTALLGTAANAPLTSKDSGKALKLIASDRYGLTAAGDEIEGTVEAIDPAKVGGGFAYGTINACGRRLAIVDNAQANFGQLVVAGVQTARDTAGGLVVRPGAPTVHVWRVVSTLGGTGTVGTQVVIERVNAS